MEKDLKGDPMKDEEIVFLLVEYIEQNIEAFYRAWNQNNMINNLQVVRDGNECFDSLHRRGRNSMKKDAPEQSIILLINQLLRLGGRKVLEIIWQNNDFNHTPVVMLLAPENHLNNVQRNHLDANAHLTNSLKYINLLSTASRISRFLELVDVPETLR
jgi:hypothetical protein